MIFVIGLKNTEFSSNFRKIFHIAKNKVDKIEAPTPPNTLYNYKYPKISRIGKIRILPEDVSVDRLKKMATLTLMRTQIPSQKS